MSIKLEIDKEVDAIKEALVRIVTSGKGKSIVKAPPGSGKTQLLTDVAARAHDMKMMIAVATQTNNQADELCQRLASRYKGLNIIRYVSASAGATASRTLPYTVTSDIKYLSRPAIVVGTSAKWGLVRNIPRFDILFVEEAWQMAYDAFLLFSERIAPNLVMIGDPGQVSPVVTIPIDRWATHLQGPHLPSPEVIKRIVARENIFELPATRRLPQDTAEFVKKFYDFPFHAYAEKGERRIEPAILNKSSAISRGLFGLKDSSILGFTIKTPKSGLPREKDSIIADAAVKTVLELLASKAKVHLGDKVIDLEPKEIGIIATHKIMVNEIDLRLPQHLRGIVKVDTVERWQGLERHAMIAVHPLSNNTSPSNFDLETGRLCVMASRHQAGMIIITRDHIQETLANNFPQADHPFAAEDVSGKGHFLHQHFWDQIIQLGHITEVDDDVA